MTNKEILNIFPKITNKSNLNLAFISPSEKEFLVAEISQINSVVQTDINGYNVDDLLLLEVNQEKGQAELEVEIYPRQDGQPWKLNFKEFLEKLLEAKQRLVGDVEQK
jgi:hypothetical protein